MIKKQSEHDLSKMTHRLIEDGGEKVEETKDEVEEFIDNLIAKERAKQQGNVGPEDRTETAITDSQKEKELNIRKFIGFLLIALLFTLALGARLYVIFFVTDPDNPGAGWFGDAYHHWQIAYLSQEIGFHHGFLRLWDLKGMEYFWGLLHPLVVVLAFAVTGIQTVGLERVVTALGGSISVVLLYYLGKKYWNKSVGVAAALLAALNPVGVFNDGTGMVEPIGIPFLLGGVLVWPKRPALAGLLLGIAVLSRAEYWVFAIGLVMAMIIFTPKKEVNESQRVIFGISFFVVVFLYMKYLLDHTTNPIYPFYENYMANVLGGWQHKMGLSPGDEAGRTIFRIITTITVFFTGLTLWKRPRGWLVILLGLGSWLFLGLTFGFTEYIKSWADYVWIVRFMLLQYMFLGLVLAVFLFYVLRQNRWLRWLDFLKVNWLVLLVVLAISQLAWMEIMKYYRPTEKNWEKAEQLAAGMAKHYQGGGFLMPEGNPELTYALVKNHGLEGKNIVGQMFDPYFYMDDRPYDNWGENREIVLDWFKSYNIKYMVVYTQAQRYAELVKREPDKFEYIGDIPNSNLVVYRVLDWQE